jgi:hypothetical protein
MGEDMPFICASFTKAEKKKFTKLARSRNTSLSELILALLRRETDRAGKSPPRSLHAAAGR